MKDGFAVVCLDKNKNAVFMLLYCKEESVTHRSMTSAVNHCNNQLDKAAL